MTGKNNVIRHFILNGFSLQSEIRNIVTQHSDSYFEDPIFASPEEIIEPFLDLIADHDQAAADHMANYYKIIFQVENKIRGVVYSTLFDEFGDSWWDNCAPEDIRNDVKALMSREVDMAISPRSTDMLSYTTMGQLSIIIQKNKDHFSPVFTSIKGVGRAMATLNAIRAPIAHCSVLTDDEVARLYLAVRDLFRLFRKTYILPTT